MAFVDGIEAGVCSGVMAGTLECEGYARWDGCGAA